jgi:hypothetical protein
MKINASLFFFFISLSAFGQTTIDFADFPIDADSFYNGNDLSGGFEQEDFFFPNTFLEDPVYGGFWINGWAVSSQTDSVTSGFLNLFSTKAGMAFSDHNFSIGQANPVLRPIGEGIAFIPQEVYLTNTTYAHNSMRDGDFFAKPFGGATGDDPDFFKLVIYGFQNGEPKPDSLEFFLADYRFEDNSQDYIVDTWEYLDLSPIGPTDSLQFVFRSSDVSANGINTPLFFCMDDFSYEIVVSDALDPTTSSFWKLAPNPGSDLLNILLTNPDSDAVTFQILNACGRLIKEVDPFQATPIHTTDWPSGVYWVRQKGTAGAPAQKWIKL